MGRKRTPTQISNLKTIMMYRRQMESLTKNVILLKGLPSFLDLGYINKILYKNGSIAFFVDEVLGLLALPYRIIGCLDVYGRPLRIQAYARNDYYSRILNQEEFVILYDNMGKYPFIFDVYQYAERMALATRTIDINISQQKTNRFYYTSQENVNTVKNILNNIDAFENEVLADDDYKLLDNLTAVLEPAPYVADKLQQSKEQIWAEFLRVIGICSITTQKKERLIRDEVEISQGGTIAGRYNRSQPREIWKSEMKEKLNIEVDYEFYDGLPTSIKEPEYLPFYNPENNNQESEVESNVL